MDDLNKKIALQMQRVADTEFEVLAPFMQVGSYTANQVFEHFETIQINNEREMRSELCKAKKPNGKEYDRNDIDDYCREHFRETLTSECMEDVTIQVDSFKCCTPRYLLFKILHKFEKLAGIVTKNRKKFIRQADSGKLADISFQVEITKDMMCMGKMVSGDGLGKITERVALDYERGYVVASDGHIMHVMKADFKSVYVKDGLRKDAVAISVPIFKQCQGNLAVEVQVMNDFHNKYIYTAEDGGCHEEDAAGKYPWWWQCHPKELFVNGRVTLSKDGVKQLLKFAKQAEKNGIGGQMCFQGGCRQLAVSYRNYADNLDEITQEIIIPTENEIPSFTIGLNAKLVQLLYGWNGTMWVTDSSKMVILDKDEPTDYFILIPTMLPDDMYGKNEINGTKVAFESRHQYYKNQPQKQQTKTKKKQTETENHNSKNQIFMAAERYEGTEAFYSLEQIENGEFRVKGSKHDSDLVLFLRTTAHYIRRKGQQMQSEFCAYCSKQMEGKDWRSLVPMEELALAEMFEGFLASKGIDDIPDVEFEDVIEEAEPEAELQGRATIDFEPIEEEVEEVIEAEAEEIIEEAAEEVIEEPEVVVKPMAIEREIVPTLELETTDGVLIIAGESYFRKLYDEENGCFRSEAAEAKFNEIDAFIADELILADVLDYAAITDAVVEFMEAVEQAS